MTSSNFFKNAICFLIITLATINLCEARVESKKHLKIKNCKSRVKIEEPVKVEMVVNLNNGKILHKYNHTKKFYPASLTKVMTAYLAFKEIKLGKLKLNSLIKVPEHATKVPRCKIYLKPGEKIRLIDALNATIISSANDAAETVIYKIADNSRDNVAKIMNLEAKKLGMKNTSFYNGSGLHNPNQKTTALDMVKLASAVKFHFPEFYQLFSNTSYDYNGEVYQGHNNVTKLYPGAEGLKTGYLRVSGSNLVTIATKKGVTLIGVIAGGSSSKSRDLRMMELLDKAFRKAGVRDI